MCDVTTSTTTPPSTTTTDSTTTDSTTTDSTTTDTTPPGMSLLVVGAGFTGSTLCKILRSTAPQLTLNVWEKSRGIGGRQATKRDGQDITCDMGTQYITCFRDDSRFQEYVKELRATNVIQKFEGKIEDAPAKFSGDCDHYVARNGMNSTSKFFMSGTTVFFQNRVASLKVQNDKIEVCNEEGRRSQFDSVIFTIPAPQLLDIDMDGRMMPEVRENLSKVEFTPRFTVIMVFDFVPEFDWTMKYYQNDKISFTAWDNIKRMHGKNPVLLVHSSALFAVNNTDVKTKEEAGMEMVERVRELYPELPEPKKVLYHFWRYSQTYKPYEGKPGFVTISENPLILAGGDSFTSTSNMSACVHSAEGLASKIKQFCGME